GRARRRWRESPWLDIRESSSVDIHTIICDPRGVARSLAARSTASAISPSIVTRRRGYHVMLMSLRRVFSSSVGTKLLIGATGLLLFAYLLLHLAGNLLVFAGQNTFNEYAHMLISNPLTTPVEVGLLLVFLIHVYKTVTMWFAN